MKFIDKFNQLFGFTRTESRAIVFLVAAFLVGICLRMFHIGHHPSHFDYASSDSEFAARSRSIDDPPRDSTLIQEASAAAISPPMNSRDRRIDINTATKDELIALPGIGDAMAERIIMYREENGPFRSCEDLGQVKGIGKKKLERILPRCTIGK